MSKLTAKQALELIESAKLPIDLFGTLKSGYAAMYRDLLVLVHPDRFTDPQEKLRASDASGKLADFYGRGNGKVPAIQPSKLGKWIVDSALVGGEICNLYLADSPNKPQSVLKLVKDPADNDLMKAEITSLRQLAKCPSDLQNFRKYIPEVMDTFQVSGKHANVLTFSQDHYSLTNIQALIGQLPFRHCVWMFNRLTSALGFMHRAGIVHGGITPDHLMYHPKSHGLMVVGWCSSVTISGSSQIPIMSEPWESIYPREIRDKNIRGRYESASPASDIYMSAKTIEHVASSIPRRFKPLLEYCTAESPSVRIQDAWDLQERWVELAKEEYGRPQYLELVIPKQ